MRKMEAELKKEEKEEGCATA